MKKFFEEKLRVVWSSVGFPKLLNQVLRLCLDPDNPQVEVGKLIMDKRYVQSLMQSRYKADTFFKKKKPVLSCRLDLSLEGALDGALSNLLVSIQSTADSWSIWASDKTPRKMTKSGKKGVNDFK